MKAKTNYSIVMFAYNEEKNIERSVASVFENTNEELKALYVLANGCTDQTVPVLKRLQQTWPKLEVIELEVGDKCNAWNHYVHEVASSDSEVHFFTDADVYFSEKVFVQLSEQLRSVETANAVAGLPLSGRNREFYRDLVINRDCFFGNCYGLKFRFIELARQAQFKLPVGLCWIDSAITKAVNSDIKDQQIGIDGRVTYKEGCGYLFTSLSPLKWDDIQLYLSRIARYETGKLQEKYLENMAFSEWPETLNEINQKILACVESGETKVTWYLRGRIIRRLKKKLVV